MAHNASENLGTKPIGPLIRQQSIPAAIGILVMSLNMIIDTIFVGNCIGAVAIAVITVVLPIVFLVSANKKLLLEIKNTVLKLIFN